MLNLPDCETATDGLFQQPTSFGFCFFVLSGTVSVLSDDLHYAPGIGVQGSISFEGCIAQNCMNELVTIRFVVQFPGRVNETLVSTQVIPGFLPFPVNGLLDYTSPIDSDARKFIEFYQVRHDLYPDSYLLKDVRLEKGKLSCPHSFF